MALFSLYFIRFDKSFCENSICRCFAEFSDYGLFNDASNGATFSLTRCCCVCRWIHIKNASVECCACCIHSLTHQETQPEVNWCWIEKSLIRVSALRMWVTAGRDSTHTHIRMQKINFKRRGLAAVFVFAVNTLRWIQRIFSIRSEIVFIYSVGFF